MKSLCCFILLILNAGQLFAQDVNDAPQHNRSTDSLIVRYLSDNKQITAKVNDIIYRTSEGRNAPQDKARLMELYQIGLILTSYIPDSSLLQSKLYARFSRLLHESGAHDMAVAYMKTAYHLLKKAKPGPCEDAYNMLGGLGSYYLNAKQYDSSSIYFNLAADEAKQLPGPIWLAAAYNNIGMLRTAIDRDDEALRYFEMAIKKAHPLLRRIDSSLHGSITDNLAALALKQGKSSSALMLYTANVALYNKLGGGANLLQAGCGVMNALIALHHYPEATAQLEYVSQARAQYKNELGFDNELKCLQAQEGYYRATDNIRELLKIQETIMGVKDAIARKEHQMLDGVYASLAYSRMYRFRSDVNHYKQELSFQQTRSRNRVLALSLIGLLLISSLIFVIIFYRNRRALHRSELELHKTGQQLAHAELVNERLLQEQTSRELSFRKKDIADLTLYLNKLKSMYDAMLEKLEDMKDQKPGSQQDALRRLANEVGAQLQSQEKLTLIQENVQEVSKEFNHKLIHTYPELSRSEIELCGLLRLNMSNKEIGSLKGISPESAKMSRYRLRKKLALQPEEDIYKFLADF